MARGFRSGVQCILFPRFLRPMSPWGLMGSFGLREGVEGGGEG